MRIGWRQGSMYEWTQHWRVARKLEIPEDDLVGTRDWKSSDRFDRADRAVMAATDETLASGAISAGTWAELETTVPDERARLEVVVSIANWSMFAQLLRSLELPLEEGVDPWTASCPSRPGPRWPAGWPSDPAISRSETTTAGPPRPGHLAAGVGRGGHGAAR